jgi:hypothetical protein
LLTTPSPGMNDPARERRGRGRRIKSSQAPVLPTDSLLVLAAPCHHVSHSCFLCHCHSIMSAPNSNSPHRHYGAYGANTTTTGRSKTTTMPPGVDHPQAGKVLGPDSCRCECGGTTGVCGTPQGANKWRDHMRTSKHVTWDPLFN